MDFVETVEEFTRKGRQMNAEEVVRKLMYSRRPAHDQQRALLGQVNIARNRRNTTWLKKAAKEAEVLQFASSEWISENMYRIVSKRSSEASASSKHCTTDIRLKTEPTLERRVEDAATGDAEDAEKLIKDIEQHLLETSMPELDYRDELALDEQEPAVSGPVSDLTTKEVKKGTRQQLPKELQKPASSGSGDSRRPIHSRERVKRRSPRKGRKTSTESVSEAPTQKAAGQAPQVPADSGPECEYVRQFRRVAEQTGVVDAQSSKVPLKAMKKRVYTERSRSNCPLSWCTGDFRYPSAHAFVYYLPTGVDRDSTGREADKRRAEFVRYLAAWASGRKDAAPGCLLEFMARERLEKGNEDKQCGTWVCDVVKKVSKRLGIVAPNRLTLSPINSPVLVFHWALLLQVLRRMSRQEYNELQRRFSDPTRGQKLDQHLAPEDPVVQEEEQHPVLQDDEDLFEMLVVDEVGEEPLVASDLTICVTDEREVKLSSNASDVPKAKELMAVCSAQSEEAAIPGEETISGESMEIEACSTGIQVPGIVVEADSDGESRLVNPSRRNYIREGAVDSHFHLDRLCLKLGESEYDFSKVLSRLTPYAVEHRVCIGGAVANFCDPVNYPSVDEISSLRTQGVETSIGLHPKHAAHVSSRVLSGFQGLVGLPEVCAFGEVGLDHTVPAEEWATQHDVLYQVLQFLEPRHVLVLHCRSKVARETSELIASLIYQCAGVVPRDQKIHPHCFTGTVGDVNRWVQRFPNVCFGFTAMVGSFNEEQKEALRMLPSERLLLETDAPYFPLHGYSLSSPTFLGMTAQLVADIRGVTKADILTVTAQNAHRMYWS